MKQPPMGGRPRHYGGRIGNFLSMGFGLTLFWEGGAQQGFCGPGLHKVAEGPWDSLTCPGSLVSHEMWLGSVPLDWQPAPGRPVALVPHALRDPTARGPPNGRPSARQCPGASCLLGWRPRFSATGRAGHSGPGPLPSAPSRREYNLAASAANSSV